MTNETTLGSVAQFLNSSRIPISKAERAKRQGEFPYYGATGVLDFVDDFLFEGLHVLIGEDGTVIDSDGRPVTQIVQGRFWVSNHAHVVRGADDTDSRFIYYALAGVAVQPFITGSAQPKLSLGNARQIPIQWPDRNERDAIVGVLGALDDKIESNRRLASTCEQLAVGLLEDGLNQGVTIYTVGEVAEFKNKNRRPLSSLQRAEMTGHRVYPYYGATGVFDHVDDYLFDELTVLVGEDGSVVNDDGSPVVQLAWGKYWVNNHAHVLVGATIESEVLYVALRRSDIRPLVTGAVQAKVSMGNLRSLVLELPPESLWEALGREINDIISRMRSAHDESSSLKSLRDALLPELLSGRLRVREAERVVEEVI
jgi:type I restriction enzyme S subunit